MKHLLHAIPCGTQALEEQRLAIVASALRKLIGQQLRLAIQWRVR